MDMIERLLAALDNIPVSVVIADADGNIIYANPSFNKISGFTKDDLSTDRLLAENVIFLNDKASILHQLKTGFNFITEEKHSSKRGDDIIESVVFIPFKDSSGLMTHVIRISEDITERRIIFEDITARKRTEDQLRKLSVAVEQSPASVVITDINGNIEYVNPKFTRLTGYEFNEVVGGNPRILKSGFQSDEYYKKMWDVILSGEEWQGEFHNKKKNGDYYWEIASISPIRGQDGIVTHFLAVKEDITGRKAAEEALLISEDTLRKKNDAMVRELNFAQFIIKKFLPETAPFSNFIKIDYRYLPLDEIGGDYFSFFSIDENNTGLFLGDVAGHGVSAALFLSLVKSASERIFLTDSRKPSAYLKELNKELSNTMVSHFMTALYGFFKADSEGLEFIFARGGHPPPVFYSMETGNSSLIMSSGKPLGLFHDLEFEEKRIPLSKGDRIYLYTDGLTEMLTPGMNLLGFEGLMDIIDNCYNPDIKISMDSILKNADVSRGQNPIDDDIILIGIEAL